MSYHEENKMEELSKDEVQKAVTCAENILEDLFNKFSMKEGGTALLAIQIVLIRLLQLTYQPRLETTVNTIVDNIKKATIGEIR